MEVSGLTLLPTGPTATAGSGKAGASPPSAATTFPLGAGAALCWTPQAQGRGPWAAAPARAVTPRRSFLLESVRGRGTGPVPPSPCRRVGVTGASLAPGLRLPGQGCRSRRSQLRGAAAAVRRLCWSPAAPRAGPGRSLSCPASTLSPCAGIFPGARAGSASNPAWGSAVPSVSRFVRQSRSPESAEPPAAAVPGSPQRLPAVLPGVVLGSRTRGAPPGARLRQMQPHRAWNSPFAEEEEQGE